MYTGVANVDLALRNDEDQKIMLEYVFNKSTILLQRKSSLYHNILYQTELFWYC